MNWTVVTPSQVGSWLGGCLMVTLIAFGGAVALGQCGCTPQAPANAADSVAYTLEQKACVDEAKDAGSGHAGADACHARVKAKWEAR